MDVDIISSNSDRRPCGGRRSPSFGSVAPVLGKGNGEIIRIRKLSGAGCGPVAEGGRYELRSLRSSRTGRSSSPRRRVRRRLDVDWDQVDCTKDPYTGPIVLSHLAGTGENANPGHEALLADNYEEEVEDLVAQFEVIRALPCLNLLVDKWRVPVLPMMMRRQAGRKTLVLDLDETLVHSWINEERRHDLMFRVSILHPDDTAIFVRKRPHLVHFLKHVCEWFEVVVFTASQRIYADRLLSMLDPEKKYFKHRLFRDSCVEVDGVYVKDLSLLGRDLSNVVIVDNLVQAFGFQLDNGVPIASFYEDDQDSELLKLLSFLHKLIWVPDVRPFMVDKFRLRQIVYGMSPVL